MKNIMSLWKDALLDHFKPRIQLPYKSLEQAIMSATLKDFSYYSRGTDQEPISNL